ncbi:unnamed protein product [Staurois parvus]|uniref:Uncharacterized protein n=1 Tax=Staurois parvus TaxID=386267 RepID=A0ABN9B750_9NEOB|nr:unnamed protein product [Staurois parvus]
MDRGEFVTHRASIPKGTGKGEAGSRKKRNSNQIGMPGVLVKGKRWLPNIWGNVSRC